MVDPGHDRELGPVAMPVSPVADPPSPGVVGLLSAVIDDVLPHTEELARQSIAIIVAEDPRLAGDDSVVQTMERAAVANIRATLPAFTARRPREDVPVESLALATLLAERDLDLGVLIQIYRTGQRPMYERLLREFAGRTSDAALLSEATVWASHRYFSYLDLVLSRSAEQHSIERQRWRRESASRRWRAVRDILDGRLADEKVAGHRLGHDLAGIHLAMIAVRTEHTESADDHPRSLVDVVRDLGSRLGGRDTFTVSAGPGELYAWVALPRCLAPAQLDDLETPDGVAISAGIPAPGLTGFKRSHEQAGWALRIARRPHRRSRVVAYGSYSAMPLIRDDPEQLRQFVALHLGGLAAKDEAAARARSTLLATLAEGMNASRAAKRLYLHKNTVLYRLKSAEVLRGRPLSEQRFELEFALRLVETLGDAVLG